MRFDFRAVQYAGKIALSTAAAGTLVVAALAATHPAIAASTFGVLTGAVSCATTTACVAGSNTSTGPGVSGSSAKGVAVTGSGVSGMTGTGTTGYGIEGVSNSSYGVEGVSTSNDGLKGVSTSSNGISGTSSSLAGVKGSSNSNYGVYGSTTSGTAGVYGTTSNNAGDGVYGLNTSTNSNANGVYGSAVNGDGVQGLTVNGFGVQGSAPNGFGVVGTSQSDLGVYGVSISGIGIYAQSQSSDGIYASTQGGGGAFVGQNMNGAGALIVGTQYGVIARATGNTSNYPLYLTDQNTNPLFYVDGTGSVFYKGSLNNFSRSASGATVKSYSPKTTLATVEDYGSAQLVGGVAVVRLDTTFASSIDMRDTYRVFLTPNGDTHELYVPTKTASGFIVREAQGGRSTTTFDYRIVATALGAAGQRMTIARMPYAKQPALAPPVALPRGPDLRQPK